LTVGLEEARVFKIELRLLTFSFTTSADVKPIIGYIAAVSDVFDLLW